MTYCSWNHTLSGWGDTQKQQKSKDTKQNHSKRLQTQRTSMIICLLTTSCDVKYVTLQSHQRSIWVEVYNKLHLSYHCDVLLFLCVANSVPLDNDPCPVLCPPCTGHDVSWSDNSSGVWGLSDAVLCVWLTHTHNVTYVCVCPINEATAFTSGWTPNQVYGRDTLSLVKSSDAQMFMWES